MDPIEMIDQAMLRLPPVEKKKIIATWRKMRKEAPNKETSQVLKRMIVWLKRSLKDDKGE